MLEEEEEEEDGEIGFCNFTYVIVAVYFATFESRIVYTCINTCRPCYMSVAATFEGSEQLHLLKLNGHVSTIPT